MKTINSLEDMADPEHYAAIPKVPHSQAHKCQVLDCNISQEEHHRLAFGMVAENRELKRRLAALENGHAQPVAPANHHEAVKALRSALALLEGAGMGLATDALEGAL